MGRHKVYLTEEDARLARNAKARERYERNKESEQARARANYYKNKDQRSITGKKRRQDSQTDIKIFISEMLAKTKSNAKRRNIEFKLTKHELTSLFDNSNGRCDLSGVEMHTSFNSPFKVTIDRIDSSKGYEIGNVQLVARCVNVAKSNLVQKDFIAMCKAVVDFNS